MCTVVMVTGVSYISNYANKNVGLLRVFEFFALPTYTCRAKKKMLNVVKFLRPIFRVFGISLISIVCGESFNLLNMAFH